MNLKGQVKVKAVLPKFDCASEQHIELMNAAHFRGEAEKSVLSTCTRDSESQPGLGSTELEVKTTIPGRENSLVWLECVKYRQKAEKNEKSSNVTNVTFQKGSMELM